MFNMGLGDGNAMVRADMKNIPSPQDILDFIRDNPGKSSKREIARAFGLKGAAKIELKHILRDLADQGHIEKRRRNFGDPNRLPPVAMLRVSSVDAAGDMFADPVEWSGDEDRPTILILHSAGDAALATGDRVLTKLTKVSGEGHEYTGRVIRKIGTNPSKVLGIFRTSRDGGRIIPIDKKSDKDWLVPSKMDGDAKDGELVEGEAIGSKSRVGLPKAKVVAVLGDPGAPKSISLIAIAQHGIPDQFEDDVIAQADADKPASPKGRTDLTHLPLITIDPHDARDHDDACCAIAHDDGGFTLWVAIADVAHYVTPGSPLDRAALERGNSSYFPDRVVPMLPDVLSGDLCSLHEGVDRPCIAVEININPQGEKLSHQFHRGWMNSPAALSYEEAQAAIDGRPTDRAKPLVDSVLKPLFAAYEALKHARNQRQPLELDLPERKIVLSDMGEVTSIQFSDRFDAHKLIEEFMVLANVCAAETLQAKNQPLLFRNHEEPDADKLDALRETAKSVGLKLAKGQVLQTRHLNQLLNASAGMDEAELINISTLRSMSQAFYGPENLSHFGLALKDYAHFTSPIRRYADLLVHRALISAHGWGDDGLSDIDHEKMKATGEHISGTERRSMVAERDTTDRYVAQYLVDRVGSEFKGRIAGIAKFGVFVKLDETGADGLVPMRELGREYFHYDRDSQTLMGADTGTLITMGMRATVRLAEATPITGGLIFELLDIENVKIAKPSKRGPMRGKGRGASKGAKHKVRRVKRNKK